MRFLLKGAQNEKNKSISCCVGNRWIDYKFIFLMSKQLQQNSNQLFVASKIKNKQENSDNSVNHDELLTLVNYENSLPENWKVDLVSLNNGQVVDRRIYKDLMEMLQTAKKEGLNLLICSSYRTQKNKNIFIKTK